MFTLVLRATRALLLFMLAVGVLMILGAPSAHAADGSAPSVEFALNLPLLLNMLIATVFPLFVGVVTKKTASGRLKAILLATIAFASGLASQLLAAVTTGVPFDLFAALITGLTAWLIAIGTYEGFWKPTGVGDAAQAIGVGASTRVNGAHNE